MDDGEDQFLHYLGKAAREYRDAIRPKLIRATVSGAVPCDVSTLRDFEKGLRWPSQTGVSAILDSYVHFCGLEDRYVIVKRAIDLGREAEAARQAAAGRDLAEEPPPLDKPQPKPRAAPSKRTRQAKPRRRSG